MLRRTSLGRRHARRSCPRTHLEGWRRLLGGGWKGQAADAFRRDWEQWLHGAKDVVGGLDSMSSLLASSAHSYSSQEIVANASAVGQSGTGLNMAV